MTEKGIEITTKRCVLQDDYLWYVNLQSAIVCRTNIKSWKTEIVTKIPREYYRWDSFTYDCGVIYEDRLILYPEFENWILDVNIETRKVEGVSIHHLNIDDSRTTSGIKFKGAYRIDDKVYFLPCSCHCILEYDLNEKKLVEYSDWYREFFCDERIYDNSLFIDSLFSEKKFWFLCKDVNAIMEFDPVEKKAKLHYVGDLSCRFSAFSIYKKEFVIWDYKNSTMLFWKGDNTIKRIDLSKHIGVSDQWDYLYFNCDEDIYLIPHTSNKLVIISNNESRARIEVVEISETKYMSITEVDEENLLFMTMTGKKSVIFNKKNKSMNYRDFFVNQDDIPLSIYNEENIWDENGRDITVYKLINYVSDCH